MTDTPLDHFYAHICFFAPCSYCPSNSDVNSDFNTFGRWDQFVSKVLICTNDSVFIALFFFLIPSTYIKCSNLTEDFAYDFEILLNKINLM